MDAFVVISLIKAAVIAFVLLTAVAYLQWVERKVIAHIQLRMGPYRVGPHGLLQPLADVIKLITKEDMMPSYVNKPIYLLAPFIAVSMSLLSIAVIPFGPTISVAGYQTGMQLADLNIGVLYILAVSSMGVYGVALAGWASNNKYALLGGLRSSAQMISYEIPMALAIASPLLISNTLSLKELVATQSGSVLDWNVLHRPFPQIIAFLIFLIAGFAETNRVPFDLPEAENELVAGFHTEYSSMKFASFFMAEYLNMVTVSSLATLLFLGGWEAPWPAAKGSNLIPSVIFLVAGRMDKYTLAAFGMVFLALAGVFVLPIVQSWLLPLFWFCAKAGAILFAFMWVRGTLPRFRYDQLMQFAWKRMLPVSLALVSLSALFASLSAWLGPIVRLAPGIR